MKLSDIPKHVTDLKIGWLVHKHFGDPNMPEENWYEVTPLFHLNYYDGPLSGVFKFRNKNFYGKAVYPDERTYWAVFELTEQEEKDIFFRHEQFRKHVGNHTTYYKNYEDEWVRVVGSCHPQGQWEKFYKDETLPKINYAEIESREIFALVENPFS